MAKLITPPFRGSFVHLVEPHAPAPGAEPKYSITVALPKSDPQTKAFLEQLQRAALEAASAKWGPDKAARIIEIQKHPLIHDGDNQQREEPVPELTGTWYFQASGKRQPGIVGPDLQPLLDPNKLYSGAWYRVSVRPFAWEHPTGGKGVSLGLNNVQWLRDDTPYGGGSTPEDDFEPVDPAALGLPTDAPAPTAAPAEDDQGAPWV